MARDHRRLAAIVSADVVGYSLLMGRDDSATLAGLKAHRRELIDPKIAEYGGRIVKTTGDGLLLEFPSVVDAVRCSVDVQRGMAERTAGVPLEQRIEFRIGINVGDIIIDAEDIFGDGVNIAARLQTLADPGGICVSKVVRDQVLDKLSFSFEDLGAQEVKNIARPVEVFRVDLASGAVPSPTRSRSRWRGMTRGPWRWFAGGILAVAIAGVTVLALPKLRKTATPASEVPSYSVAILPFAASSANSTDEQFADAVTKDVTMAIVRDRRMSVTARDDAAAFNGKAIDVRAVGRELNVRYLVKGEVRRTEERTIVSVSLIDTGTATQLWSDNLEAGPAEAKKDISSFGAPLARRLREAISAAEHRRASKALPHGASAMDIAQHAGASELTGFCTGGADCVMLVLEARKGYDKALQLDPNLTLAITGRADTLNDQLFFDLHADHDRLVRDLDKASARAVSADPDDAWAWKIRASALAWQWRWPAAVEAAAREMSLDRLSLEPFLAQAEILLRTGHPAEALVWADRALALQPQNPFALALALLSSCQAHQALGRYDEAIAACERSVAQSDLWWGHLYLVAAYAQRGDTEKTRAEKTELFKEQPGITITDLKSLRVSNDSAYLQQTEAHLYAGLRKAGVPEQ